MKRITFPVEVLEFLRPENTEESVQYHLPIGLQNTVRQLLLAGIDICLDVYSTGRCTAYLYRPIGDVTLLRTDSAYHSVAMSKLIEVLLYIDLDELT